MSLLPSRMSINDPMPSLGELVKAAIQPQRDPITEFETGNHLPSGKSRSQLLRERGYTRRPSAKSLPSDADEEVSSPVAIPSAPAQDGWIEHKPGNPPPVPDRTKILARFADGDECEGRSTAFIWYDGWGQKNVVAYRVLP